MKRRAGMAAAALPHGFAAVLFLLPLLVVPASDDSFNLPKWTLLALATIVLAVLSVAAALSRVPVRIALHPVNGLLIALWLWMMASVAWAESPLLAWQHVRRFGLVVGFVLLLQSCIAGRRDRVLQIIGAVAAASLLVAIGTIVVDAIAGFSPASIGVIRTLGDWRDFVSLVGFGNSGHIADFLAVGFLAWLGTFLMARIHFWRRSAVVALWLHAAALIVTWSVHSNASLIIASLVAVIMLRGDARIFRWKRRARAWATLAGGFAFVIAFYAINHPLNPHGTRAIGSGQPGIFAQAFASPRWHEGGPTRLVIWYNTLEVIRHHPWLGTGAGNFTYAYPAFTSQLVSGDPALAPYAGRWTNAAHNDLLQVWSETGIIGLFLIIGLVAASLKRTIHRMREEPIGNRTLLAFAAAALVAMSLQAQMNFPLELPTSLVLFALLCVVPELVPPRGAAAGAQFIAIVERIIGPARVRIGLENMNIPREIGLSFDLGAPARIALTCAATIAAVPFAWHAIQPLRADIAYRPAHEAVRSLRAFENPARDPRAAASLAQFLASARRTLAIWPNHIDCRSALSGILVQTGQWEDALTEARATLLGLNSVEVHERIAIALEALRRRDEARAEWDIVFARQPSLGDRHPQAYEEWWMRQSEM